MRIMGYIQCGFVSDITNPGNGTCMTEEHGNGEWVHYWIREYGNRTST